VILRNAKSYLWAETYKRPVACQASKSAPCPSAASLWLPLGEPPEPPEPSVIARALFCWCACFPVVPRATQRKITHTQSYVHSSGSCHQISVALHPCEQSKISSSPGVFVPPTATSRASLRTPGRGGRLVKRPADAVGAEEYVRAVPTSSHPGRGQAARASSQVSRMGRHHGGRDGRCAPGVSAPLPARRDSFLTDGMGMPPAVQPQRASLVNQNSIHPRMSIGPDMCNMIVHTPVAICIPGCMLLCVSL